MARPTSRHPTELELEILKILWRQGPASGCQVRDALAPARELAYTSVMTILNIMTRKGYVRRKKEASGYVYRAAVAQDAAERGMLQDMVDRVFDGSAVAVVQHLIETSGLDADELTRIRQLIARKAKEQGNDE